MKVKNSLDNDKKGVETPELVCKLNKFVVEISLNYVDNAHRERKLYRLTIR